jgi:hypothetical protein
LILCRLNQKVKIGSTCIYGPTLNRHNRHSKSILSVTKRRRFIPHLRGGSATPRGPVAPPNRHTGQNRCKEPTSTASGERIRSVQVRRRWIIGPAAHPHPAAPMKMGRHPLLTSLTYERSLTPAGSYTPQRSISFPLFFVHLK